MKGFEGGKNQTVSSASGGCSLERKMKINHWLWQVHITHDLCFGELDGGAGGV